jgi:hypothetical protein
MTDLAMVSALVGSLYVLTHAPLLASPEAAREGLRHFPRHRWLGRLLTLAAVAWTAWLVWRAALGFAEPYKAPLVVVGAPLTYYLTVTFVDELLAPRALGVLLLLAAEPILAARWDEHPLRLLIAVLAYVWVLAGMVLVVSPYWFRRATERLLATRGRTRAVGALGVGFGVLLLAVAWLAL